ncbi:MAG: AmpG family muropeptide MFS transporter, partial [bacterium]|nr:AmpG family muropeptide MFS transporter [bacterium]
MMQKKRFVPKFVWAFSTYFAEGFPYSIVRQISSVFFKDNGASLQAIGLTSLYGLPWTLKFLWAPFVDEFSTKRNWLLFTEIFLTAALVLISLASLLPDALPVVAPLFLIVALISATHDISIDGYYLENMNREEQAKYVGFQSMSYRIALIVGGGGIVYVSGVTSWWAAFLLSTVILGGLLIFHSLFLPKTESPRKNASELLLLIRKKRIWLPVLAIAGAIFFIQLLWKKEIAANPSGILATYFKRIGLPGLIVICLFIALTVVALNLKRIKRNLYSSKSFYA